MLEVSWLEANLDSRWLFLVILAPLIPGLFISAGVLRTIRKLDELAKKVVLEAVAISFGFTLVLVLSLGMLGLAGVPQPDGLYIALFIVIIPLVGKLFLSRKYE